MCVQSAVMGSARTAVTILKLCFSENREPTLGIGTGYRAGPSRSSDVVASFLMPEHDLDYYTTLRLITTRCLVGFVMTLHPPWRHISEFHKII